MRRLTWTVLAGVANLWTKRVKLMPIAFVICSFEHHFIFSFQDEIMLLWYEHSLLVRENILRILKP